MIEGILVIIVGTALSFAVPAHDLLASRRQARGALVGPLLTQAYPFVPARRELDQLVADADRALDHDLLLRGVASVTVIYDQAIERP